MREFLMVNEIPTFKLQLWHPSQVYALKDGVIREEQSLERALALIKVPGYFCLPLLWGNICKQLCWRVRMLNFFLHALILIFFNYEVLQVSLVLVSFQVNYIPFLLHH